MSYLQKRQQQLLKAMAKDESALKKRLSSFYDTEYAKLNNELAAYYAKYGEGNVIRHRILMERLSGEDRQLLYQRMEDFAKKYPQYAHLMPGRESIYKLNRLEGLQYFVKMQQLEMGEIDKEQITAHLNRQAMRGLNMTAEVLGLGENYYGDNSDITRLFVNVAWAGEKSFSERILGNRKKLSNYLNTDIANGIIRGDSYEKLTRQLREMFIEVSRRDAYRLIYTEGTFVFAESTLYPFTEDFEQYRISPVKDGKACGLCTGIAGQVFDIADRKAGVNFPPLHPWCRCTWEIVVDDWDKWQEDYERKHGNGKGREIAERLSDESENGIINVEIDKLVPCLEDAKTGEILSTTVETIIEREQLKSFNEHNGWYINWHEIPDDCVVCALKIKGDDDVQGLVAYKDMPENSAIYAYWAVSAPHNQRIVMGENKLYNGVGGHLFAIMAEASIKAGYDGFLYGKATNQDILNLYINKFHAKPIGGLKFYIDENAAHRLLDIYNYERKE